MKLDLRRHGRFDGEEWCKGEVGGVANCFLFAFKKVGVDSIQFSSPEVEILVDLSFSRDEDLFTTDLVISWSCRADFDLELKEADDLGVKNRENRFGVIGGGFRSLVDFLDLGDAVGTGMEDKSGSVILCTGLPSLVTLSLSRAAMIYDLIPRPGEMWMMTQIRGDRKLNSYQGDRSKWKQRWIGI
jgi:hypothetical protein